MLRRQPTVSRSRGVCRTWIFVPHDGRDSSSCLGLRYGTCLLKRRAGGVARPPGEADCNVSAWKCQRRRGSDIRGRAFEEMGQARRRGG